MKSEVRSQKSEVRNWKSEIISGARDIVAAAIARGWCSAPVFTPPVTNNQIQAARGNRDRLISRCKKSALPQRVFESLARFLERHEAEFRPYEFQNFLTRDGIALTDNTVRFYLNLGVKEKMLIRRELICPGSPVVFKKERGGK